jgi:hypothetical protein
LYTFSFNVFNQSKNLIFAQNKAIQLTTVAFPFERVKISSVTIGARSRPHW